MFAIIDDSGGTLTAPILGVTKAAHLDDPLKAVSSPLSAEEIAALEAPYQPQPVMGPLHPSDPPMRPLRAPAKAAS